MKYRAGDRLTVKDNASVRTHKEGTIDRFLTIGEIVTIKSILEMVGGYRLIEKPNGWGREFIEHPDNFEKFVSWKKRIGNGKHF